ncbi:phage tail tape measure protein [Neisseria uirgultaei]|uniref:phage tail tape measure protein n=1 Tax=Neisseria uirgultaei TaxID=2830646 RepID=UPI00272C657A|nr:phage tail tape measure protein [Neisseria uirgultaei]
MPKNLELKIIMSATDKASAAFKKLRNAGDVLGQTIDKLEDEMKGYERAQSRLTKRVELTAKTKEQTKALMENKLAQKALKEEIAKTGVPTKAQAKALEKLQNKQEKITDTTIRYQNQIEEINKELRKYGAYAADAAKAQELLEKAAKKTETALKKQQKAMAAREKAAAKAQMGDAAMRATTMMYTARGIADTTRNVLSAPVAAYAQSETASTDLRAAMMDNTGKVSAQYKDIDNLATRLGDRLPGTTADFKNLMTMLIRQGMSAQTVLGGTGEAAALLAVQLKKSPEAAAEMAAKLQDATRGTEKEMLAIMDQVQRLYYAGTDDSNILGAFSKLSPALDTLKIKGESAMKMMSPLVGMLDQAGLSGESAGNALRKVFTRMMDTKKIAKVTKGTGLSLDFTNGKGEFGGFENMYKQLAKLKSLNTEKRLKVLQGIFGDDAETLQALNTMIEKGRAGYDEFSKKLEAQASLNQRVNDQLGTLANLWDAASGTFTNFLAKMGESVAPQLKELTKWIGGINEKLSDWAAKNPETAAAIMKTAAVIGVFLTAVVGIGAALSAVLVPIALSKFAFFSLFGGMGKAAGGALGLVGTLLKLGGALAAFGAKALVFLATNPFGWAILAVGALVMLWRNWDKVKAALVSGWEWIQKTFSENPILNLVFPFIGLARLIVNNWGAISGFFSDLWAGIKAAWNEGAVYIAAIISRIGAVFMAGWGRITGFIRALPLVQWFSGKFDAVLAYLQGLGGRFLEAGKNLIQNIINGVTSKLAFLREKIGAIGSYFGRSISIVGRIADGKGFSTGGYTGAGGVNEAAGIVHKGEVVFSQRDVARFGGWQAVEALRRGGAGVLAAIGNRLGMGHSDGKPAPLPSPQRFHAAPAAIAGDTITVNVHAAPGMNEDSLVSKIMARLQEHSRAKQRRLNSSYFDKD